MPLVLPGQEVRLNEPGRTFTRHHHLQAYAALLVEGRCDEAGDKGRFTASPGDVLLHQPFDGHADRIGASGAVFINIRLAEAPNTGLGRVNDLDLVVRAFERDPAEGEHMFHQQFTPAAGGLEDWPDLLAAAVTHRPQLRLEQWADENGLHPNSLSRGFKAAYRITPKRYRLEVAASQAARRLRATSEPLSMIAVEAGFADQAHMTRAIAALFGITPRMLRRFG